jgi:hypothetical protein
MARHLPKWLPLYWGSEPWEVVPFPPAFDELGRRLAPRPPDGAVIPWWKMDKSQWPVSAPWGHKQLGVWPASKITMAEDVLTTPPWGYIKLKMPQQIISSARQIAFMNVKMQMRPEIDHFFVLTRNTPMGQKFFLVDENWNRQEYVHQEYKAKMRAKKREHYEALLSAQIEMGETQPSKDLFS